MRKRGRPRPWLRHVHVAGAHKIAVRRSPKTVRFLRPYFAVLKESGYARTASALRGQWERLCPAQASAALDVLRAGLGRGVRKFHVRACLKRMELARVPAGPSLPTRNRTGAPACAKLAQAAGNGPQGKAPSRGSSPRVPQARHCTQVSQRTSARLERVTAASTHSRTCAASGSRQTAATRRAASQSSILFASGVVVMVQGSHFLEEIT